MLATGFDGSQIGTAKCGALHPEFAAWLLMYPGRVAVDGPAGKKLISRVAAVKGFGNALDQRAARSFVAACMEILVPLFIAMLITALMLAPGALVPGG
ncbi:hypothetical protein WHZ78_07390 [Bradyrhizobium symbiodeficiens]|uniref:hypothetical protein n=1 Tax=Bradyrhizobium symbiodeficiens TaxID=1404367 RepID=UPI0030CC11A0